MAQNREQRFATASDMRKALHSSAQAPTIRDRAEAQTVLFPPKTTTVAATTEVAANHPTLRAGETTVVRPVTAIAGRRGLPWALSIAALVIVAVGVLGFVAWQWRGSTVQVEQQPATPIESPTTTPTATAEATLAETSTPEPVKRPTTDQVATRKTEQQKDTESQPKTSPPSPSPAASPERTTEERETPVQPEPVEPDVPAIPNPNSNFPRKPNVRSLPGGGTIRTFPDGTQLMTMPDGTRILTTPDGRRQVIRAPARRRRKIP